MVVPVVESLALTCPPQKNRIVGVPDCPSAISKIKHQKKTPKFCFMDGIIVSKEYLRGTTVLI